MSYVHVPVTLTFIKTLKFLLIKIPGKEKINYIDAEIAQTTKRIFFYIKKIPMNETAKAQNEEHSLLILNEK